MTAHPELARQSRVHPGRNAQTASATRFRAAAGRKPTVLEAGMIKDSPVRGLRPARSARCFRSKVPNPAMVTDPSRSTPSRIPSKTDLTAFSAWLRGLPSSAVTSSMRSLLFILSSMRVFEVSRTIATRSPEDRSAVCPGGLPVDIRFELQSDENPESHGASPGSGARSSASIDVR